MADDVMANYSTFIGTIPYNVSFIFVLVTVIKPMLVLSILSLIFIKTQGKAMSPNISS